jgi:heme-degrading monooxygenase HmoA
MIAILYRWKIKDGKKDQFISAWKEITLSLRENYGGKGSRLHLGSDGFYYAYAQWNSLKDRELAFENFDSGNSHGLMRDAVEESFPEVILEVVEDLLLANCD